jgi:phytoene dehydrogenase-like protein
MNDFSIVIIGGGMAGLTCAKYLNEQGKSFLLLESSDAFGGRVRTDLVDGFRLDRGFQVLLTNYPEARKILNYSHLRLRNFESGGDDKKRKWLYDNGKPVPKKICLSFDGVLEYWFIER